MLAEQIGLCGNRGVEHHQRASELVFAVVGKLCVALVLGQDRAMFHRAILPEDKRDAKLADDSEHQLGRPLMVLDAAVAAQPYLLGEHFTVADLNVASILSWARPARIDFGHVPKAADWLKRCAERPAASAARALQR